MGGGLESRCVSRVYGADGAVQQIFCHQVQNWSGTQGILLTDLFSCNFAPGVEWLK